MAEKKVVGRLVNTVSFQTDRASLQKALADIKKVKDAMKGLVVPANAMRKQAAAMKQQVTTKKQLVNQDKDWLIVQRAINKNKIKEEQREKRILDSKAKGLKLTERQTKANQRQQQIARKEAVARLTQGSGMKVNDMLFMRMSKQAEAYNKRRDAVLSRRDSQRLGRRINRSNSLESLHGQALGVNAAYDRRQARIHNRALADNARRDRVASQNAAKVSARRMDTIGLDRFGLTSRFGAGAGRGFDKIANQFSSGAISARMYRQQVSALRRDLSSAANAQRGFNGTLKDMRSAFVQATASYTAFAGISGAANIGKQYEARQAGMLVGTGSAEEARKQISFLDKEIYRLGLDQQIASRGFVQMSVAAKGVLGGGELQELFKGLGELSTAVQLDPFRYEKTVMAISQILNKGQLMAEEVKQQLGEQLPGSLEAIRRAVSKFIKKDITTSELFDLMKNGKLLAKDILPLLGKEFADMARQGEALKYALNSLNSVQGRLNKSFKDWVSSIYQGGLLDGLRDLYKTLDQLFYYMSQGADSAIGKFLKGFLGQLENSIAFIYNNMLDLYYMLKYDFGFAGADMELLGKVAYWAAIVGSLNAVLKLMQIIFGGAMIGAIWRAAAALTGFGGAAAAAGAAGAGGASGKGIGGFIGKVMIVGFAAQALSALARAILQIKDDPLEGKNEQDKTNITEMSGVKKIPAWIQAIDSFIFGGAGKDFALTSASRRYDKLDNLATYGPKSALYTQIPPAQNVNVNITMDKNAKDFVKAEVQQSTQQQINLLIPPSSRSK